MGEVKGTAKPVAEAGKQVSSTKGKDSAAVSAPATSVADDSSVRGKNLDWAEDA